jgi:hypothetical protein
VQHEQGTVDKVVVVIKDQEQIPLERYIFSVESMIEVEPFNKDTRFNLFSLECTRILTVSFSQRRGCHDRWISRTILPLVSRQAQPS